MMLKLITWLALGMVGVGLTLAILGTLAVLAMQLLALGAVILVSIILYKVLDPETDLESESHPRRRDDRPDRE